MIHIFIKLWIIFVREPQIRQTIYIYMFVKIINECFLIETKDQCSKEEPHHFKLPYFVKTCLFIVWKHYIYCLTLKYLSLFFDLFIRMILSSITSFTDSYSHMTYTCYIQTGKKFWCIKKLCQDWNFEFASDASFVY